MFSLVNSFSAFDSALYGAGSVSCAGATSVSCADSRFGAGAASVSCADSSFGAKYVRLPFFF